MQDVDDLFDLAHEIVHGESDFMSVEMLKHSGDDFDPNACVMYENHGRRLLFFAIQSRKVEIVKAFLNHKKIDLSLPLDFIRDPKEFQKYYNFKHVGEMNLDAPELPNPPLYYALLFGTPKMIELFLKKGCDINETFETRNSGKLNALQVAIQSRFFDQSSNSKVALVLKNGFKFNKALRETIAPTLLAGFHPETTESCTLDNLSIARAVVDSKIAINTHFENDDGRTPFMLAIAAGNFKVARYLELNRANINATDKYGRTAIYFLREFIPANMMFPN